MVNRKQSGRQQITSAIEDRRIATTSKRNRLLTAPVITKSVSWREDPIFVTTVKKRLIEAGLGGRIAATKPLLWFKNKKIRLKWAKQHEQSTVNDWKHDI